MRPLVSIICLCFNHEKFLNDALLSVASQIYQNKEIIIVDDYSNDQSRKIINKFVENYPGVIFIFNEKNEGNCRSFNKALSIAKGKYIIDFATDDIMLPDRIEKQVEAFENLDETYGVVFTNALNIDESGNILKLHYSLNEKVPSGNIYEDLLERYFINPPTMMIKKKVLEELGGYDETLAYEDFDFWVRSSKNYKYYYLNEALTKRRVTKYSHSSKFYKKGYEQMMESTYRVIQKAMWLNKNDKENQALIKRIRYESRQTFYMKNFSLVEKYSRLLKEIKGGNFAFSIIRILSKLNLNVYWIYKIYLRFRNN